MHQGSKKAKQCTHAQECKRQCSKSMHQGSLNAKQCTNAQECKRQCGKATQQECKRQCSNAMHQGSKDGHALEIKPLPMDLALATAGWNLC
eukprot:1157524-Pelagomonas_calceolata.AAC.1